MFVDITDPPAEVIRPELFASLNEAMDDLDIGRVARDAMRLQRIGTPLADVVREGVRYAAPRAEYGWDHSLATLADCLRMSQFFAESLRRSAGDPGPLGGCGEPGQAPGPDPA